MQPAAVRRGAASRQPTDASPQFCCMAGRRQRHIRRTPGALTVTAVLVCERHHLPPPHTSEPARWRHPQAHMLVEYDCATRSPIGLVCRDLGACIAAPAETCVDTSWVLHTARRLCHASVRKMCPCPACDRMGTVQLGTRRWCCGARTSSSWQRTGRTAGAARMSLPLSCAERTAAAGVLLLNVLSS